MNVAPLPDNESERLAKLRAYQILDTLPEKEFDSLTQLASYICGTPIALISLVDESRQWFKSKVGLTAAETPRDVAFCSHAILQDDVFMIADSLKDPRFLDNPLATGAPHVRFYAGAPLNTPTGERIGTLCVIDHEPRQLDAGQLAALKSLATYVVSQLELRSRIFAQNILNEELNLAKTAAETAALAKANFLANMSHEIRTPLNGIVGNASLLSDTALSEDQREMVETMMSCSDGLLTVIDDILDLSKMEAGKLQLDRGPFEIRKTVQEAINVVAVGAEKKSIVIQPVFAELVPEYVVSDQGRYRQILLNLLSNAIKFSENGAVKVEIDADFQGETTLILRTSVRDHGIGLSSEQQKNLFENFTQADASTTRKYGGSGLGLAICRRLCNLLHGSISVESSLGRGARFLFTITAEAGSAGAAASTRIGSDLGALTSLGFRHPLRILLAEDNKVNQKLVASFLKKLNYAVEIVKDGRDVIQAVTDLPFDVILMDIHMPVLDGYDAAKSIRMLGSSIQQPYIIALTASVLEPDRQCCFDVGMNDFLKKPLDIFELAAALQKAIVQPAAESSDREPLGAMLAHPGLDFSKELNAFANDFDVFHAVAKVYLQGYHSQLVRIKECIDRNDCSDLAEAAHALKGEVSNFSSTLVTIVAGQIEKLAQEESIAEASRCFDQLVNESAQFDKALTQFLSEKSSA